MMKMYGFYESLSFIGSIKKLQHSKCLVAGIEYDLEAGVSKNTCLKLSRRSRALFSRSVKFQQKSLGTCKVDTISSKYGHKTINMAFMCTSEHVTNVKKPRFCPVGHAGTAHLPYWYKFWRHLKLTNFFGFVNFRCRQL